MEIKDREMVDAYRASHPECRWCIHNLIGMPGHSYCRVKDIEMRHNKGFTGKLRARICPCYCIK